jgi:uncharacterized LabA/DUF88 family protein
MRYPDERIALFIDGPNLSGAARLLRLSIDYKTLLHAFMPEEAYYYLSVNPNVEDGKQQLLLYHLEKLGVNVVTRTPKSIVTRSGPNIFKTNMDIEIAVDMVEKASNFDRIVLCSGDSDFAYPMRKIQEKGTKVTVVSSACTKPAIASIELIRQADEFIDMADFPELFCPQKMVLAAE